MEREILDTINNVLGNALRVIHRWAISANLEVNFDKTYMVLFTRRYKIPTKKPPRLNGFSLTIKDHTKYLGIFWISK